MGVNFFKGQFYSCELSDSYTDSQKDAILDTIDTKDDCIAAGGHWNNARSNFDNVIESTLTLFEMMTTEGWTTVMYSGMDARGIDKQPKTKAQPWF